MWPLAAGPQVLVAHMMSWRVEIYVGFVAPSQKGCHTWTESSEQPFICLDSIHLFAIGKEDKLLLCNHSAQCTCHSATQLSGKVQPQCRCCICYNVHMLQCPHATMCRCYNVQLRVVEKARWTSLVLEARPPLAPWLVLASTLHSGCFNVACTQAGFNFACTQPG